MVDFGVCEDIYNYWPDGALFRGTSLILLVLGGSCFIAFISLIYFLHRQNTRARIDGFSEGKTSTLIFPLYTKILWLGAFATFVDALSNLFVPTGTRGTNGALNSFLYGGVWAIYHFVFEGVALLMLNDGVGSVAAKKSALLAGAWAVFTWAVQGWITFQDGNEIALGLTVFWATCLVVFYAALWLLPISVVFRRPCVFAYARFWCLIRIYICLSNVMRHYGVTFGVCMYLFGTSFFQSPVVAFVVYTCLLRDCKYWLGILTWEASSWAEDAGRESVRSPTVAQESLRRPLLGTSLGAHSARMLAHKMDSNKLHNPSLDSSDTSLSRKGVKILNFAFLHIDQPVNSSGGVSTQQVVLGSGSSCRVFQGTFRDRPVAIKMIFCPELTPDTVVSFYHEATLLAQLQHTNVVEVLGVCVLPPSICLVMELCEGGNLFDFLRGPAQVRAPLTLWRQLSLSWDCCSSVQFLHTHTPAVLHLDLKSLNFLLTREGRVKVADLELSREIIISPESGSTGGVVSGSELSGFKVPETLYWLAPEIIQGLPYNEKADIYSLALVVWEIFTASVPYRSLEDSLILAARNAKFLEVNGFAPGQYPTAHPDDMPYSLEHGLPSAHGRHRISMDGSVDGFGSASIGGLSSAGPSRRDSASSIASANVHMGGRGADGGRPRTQSAVSSSSSGGAGYHLHRDGGVAPLAPAPRGGRRSVSNSSRHLDGEEEAEMSTPSSAGSSKSQSEAPSPSLNQPTPHNGYLFPGGFGASQSPPPLSDLPAAQYVTPLPTSSTSGVSLLTHENLSSHSSFTSSLQPAYPHNLRAGVFAPRETDPVLIEWKRMHRHMQQDQHPAAQHLVSSPPSASHLPEFGAANAVAVLPNPNQKRPSYSRPPALPVIPASISTASTSLQDNQGTTVNFVQPVPLDSQAHADEYEHEHVSDNSASSSRSHSRAEHSSTSTTSDGAPSRGPLIVRSAPFQSDLSPILASLRSTPKAGPSSRSDDNLPPPALLPAAASPATTSRSAGLPTKLPRHSESYVQYDVHQIASDSSHHEDAFANANGDDQQHLWIGVASDDDVSFEPAAFYPSTVPARSILSRGRPLSPMSSNSSNHSRGPSSRLVGPLSGLPSPALSATGSEARIPRVTHLVLDQPSKASRIKRAVGASRKKTTKQQPVVDFSSIFVPRGDVQAQLQRLICVEHYRPTIPPDMPEELSTLLQRAWHPQPHMRPSASEFTSTIANLLDQLKQQTRGHEDDAMAHPFRGGRQEREESASSQQR